jgi:hypothetical protein
LVGAKFFTFNLADAKRQNFVRNLVKIAGAVSSKQSIAWDGQCLRSVRKIKNVDVETVNELPETFVSNQSR